MATLLFKFVFLNNASPAVVLTSTELTGGAAPTVNISSTAIADGTIASVVSGGALTYDSYTKSWSYRLASADLATYEYVGMATTTYATASPASVHCLGIVLPDALVSSRSTLDAAGVRSAVGLAAADLDTQLGALPAAVWAVTVRTLSSFGSLVADVAAAVWSYVRRTLTTPRALAETVMAVGHFDVIRGVTLDQTIEELTISETWSRLYVTIKGNSALPDSRSALQVVVSNPAAPATDGVLYVNGAAATAAQRTAGSLTVDRAAGTVRIQATPGLTAILDEAPQIGYDVKEILANGDANVLGRSTSAVVSTETAATA